MSTNLRGYGDIDNLSDDIKVLRGILARQGSAFVIDVLAESAGETAVIFKLTASERETLWKSLTNDLNQALSERL